MASPQQHPRTGIWQFRRRVPERLRPLVGKREEVRSLGTRDWEEAKRRWAIIAAEIEAKWANLTVGPKELSQKQIVAIAGEIYRAEIDAHTDNPGSPKRWRDALAFDDFVAMVRRRQSGKPDGARLATGWSHAETMLHKKYGPCLDAFLAGKGIIVSRPDYKRLILATGDAARQAHQVLHRNAEGDYTADPAATRFPNAEVLATVLAPTAPAATPHLPWRQVFDGYADEKKLNAKTRRSWGRMVEQAMAFVGSDDLRALTKQHVIDWKNELVRSGMDAATIRNVRLAAVKAMCNWAVANNLLSDNPAQGVSVAIPKKPKTREQGFTLEEAVAVLKATLVPPTGRISPDQAAARRWVPWLCAYTGARVNEVTQLRVQDVHRRRVPGHDDVWLLRITPEAGSTKNAEYRDVALHPHLIEQGFPAFVESVAAAGKEKLFFAPERARKNSELHPLSRKTGERLARWVRTEVKIDDPRIDPNHAWRHRFKSLCRDVRMDSEIRDMIQGHAPRTVAEGYGDLWPEVMLREISKLPRYEVGPA